MRPPRSSPSAPSCSAPATHSVPPSPFKHGTLKDACYRILAVAGPCGAKVQDMVKHIKARKLAHLAGSTPANTICSALSSGGAVFERIAPGTYALAAELPAGLKHRGRGRPPMGSGRVGKRNDLSVDVDDDEDGRRRAKRRGSTGGESSGLGPSPPATPNTGRLGGGAGGASGRCKGGLSLGGGLVDMGAFDQDGGRGDVWLSQRDACVEVLLNVGSEGMTVTEVVDAIQRRQLARLHGRTPHNSITRCLSADDTFIRLQPGRYALHDTRMHMCAEVLSLFSAPSEGDAAVTPGVESKESKPRRWAEAEANEDQEAAEAQQEQEQAAQEQAEEQAEEATPSRKLSRRRRGGETAGRSSPTVAAPVTPLDHVSARGGGSGGGGGTAEEERVSSDGECASEVVGDSDTATTTTKTMRQRSKPRSTGGLISSASKQPVMVRVESANYSVINADGSDNDMDP